MFIPGFCRALIVLVSLVVLAPSAWAQSLFFETEGYGWIFQADADGTLTIYQDTPSSLLPVLEGAVDEDGRFYVVDDGPAHYGQFQEIGESVVLTLGDGTEFRLNPIDALPERAITGADEDPVATFDVFWELFEHQSALITKTGTDWTGARNTYRSQITENTTPQELFDILTTMVTPLQDGHLELGAPDLEEDFSGGPTVRSLEWLQRANEVLSVISAACDQGLTPAAEGRLAHGTLGGRLGYVAMFSHGEYSETGSPYEDAEAFGQAIDAIFAGFAGLDGVILDLRFTPGGWDSVAVALASRLTDQMRLGYRKQARIGGYDDFAQPTEIYYGPQGVSLAHLPVVALVSNFTVSAGDVQAMLLKDLPNVTLVGQSTYGAFSNALPATLPNGWQLTLTNERYLSSADPGVDYEQVGIVPHIAVEPSVEALDQGRDNMLEAALDHLASQADGCVPSDVVLCLGDGRFAVEVTWKNTAGTTGPGHARGLLEDTGYFWFFDSDNAELMVKVLDGRDLNGHFWVFYGGLTHVELTLTVTDTETETVRTYHSPAGSFPGRGDTSAFPVN